MQCFNVYTKPLTYREYIKLAATPWQVPVAIAVKFLRINLGRHVQVFQGGINPCDPRTFPPIVWEHLGARMRNFQELGFRSMACESYSPPASNITTCAHYLVSEDRRSYAADLITVVQKQTLECADFRMAFFSYTDSGNAISTSDGRDDWPAPPNIHRAYRRDTSFLGLLTFHEERLEEYDDVMELPADLEGMNELFAKDERDRYEYFRARGIYGPLFPADENGNPVQPVPVPA